MDPQNNSEQALFTCSECGAAVILTDGVLLKTCAHVNSGTVANLSATVRGESAIK